MKFYFSEVDAEVSLKELLPWFGLFAAGVAMLILFKVFA